jgi:muramoyltetrapeptide carboxypeptidase
MGRDMTKVKRLNPGDTIGIISPSWGGAGAVPNCAEQGVQSLQQLGFRVVFAPHARNHNDPKIFMGFSDVTVLNIAIWKMTGLTIFNGPALLTDFAENPTSHPYTETYFRKTVTEPDPVGKIEPSEQWTEEYLNRRLSKTGDQEGLLQFKVHQINDYRKEL